MAPPSRRCLASSVVVLAVLGAAMVGANPEHDLGDLIHQAIAEGSAAGIEQAVAAGTPDGEHLFLAAEGGYTGAVKLMLGKGVDANYIQQEHTTALHAAAAGGHLDVVKALVGEGKARVNVLSGDHKTPLQMALMSNHHDVSEYLLENGAKEELDLEDIEAHPHAFRHHEDDDPWAHHDHQHEELPEGIHEAQAEQEEAEADPDPNGWDHYHHADEHSSEHEHEHDGEGLDEEDLKAAEEAEREEEGEGERDTDEL